MLFPRPPRWLLPFTLYLTAFVFILLLVANYYLLPAAEAAHHATPAEKRSIMAVSRLLMVVLLFVLFVTLMLTFRARRFFVPRDTGSAAARSKPTPYVDAWAESAKRMKTPPPPSEEPNG